MENEEIASRFGINLEALKKDQIKLAKSLSLKDSIDFSNITHFAGFSNIIVKNKIISTIILCDKNCEIIDEQYFNDKLNFPYLHGFRSYREMAAMVEALGKLSVKPEVIFIPGNGTSHSRLGIASHFSLVTGIPSIGIADSLFEEAKVIKEDIILEGKKVGRILQTKEGSNPVYVSPGNNISVATAYNLAKSFIRPPHKLPEPLAMAHKYARKVQKELFSS